MLHIEIEIFEGYNLGEIMLYTVKILQNRCKKMKEPRRKFGQCECHPEAVLFVIDIPIV